MKPHHDFLLLMALFLGAMVFTSGTKAEDPYHWSLFYSSRPIKNPDGSQGKGAKLAGIAVDAAGNVYAAEGYKTIVKIAPDGKATNLAGSTGGPAGADDGKGSTAQFEGPQGLAIDGSGNLYVTEEGSHTIRKITSEGMVTTLAGNPGQAGSADGKGAEARFGNPGAIGVDGRGNVFVGDLGNYSIRKITPEGVVSTFPHKLGGLPGGLAVDIGGNIYCVRHMHRVILKLTQDGETLATFGPRSDDKAANGSFITASFIRPFGLAIDAQGNVYMADHEYVRRMAPDGRTTTIGTEPAGRGRGELRGIAVSGTGVVYVSVGQEILKGVPPR